MNQEKVDYTFVVDADDTLFKTTENLRGSIRNMAELTLVDGAREFLTRFVGHIIIVTAGDVGEQMQKLEQVSIQDLFFPTHIVITETPEEKKSAIAHLVRSRKLAAHTTVVIGDRLSYEIVAGNMLKCTTVRMRIANGKYSREEPKSALEIPWYTVTNFYELLALPEFREQ